MAAGRIHNFAFFLLTFYFLKLFNQFEAIMQNKPNLPDAQMNVNTILTKDYEKTGSSDKGKTKPIQSQSKLIKANTKPIQTQTNPIKPNLSRRSLWRSRINTGE